MAFQNLVFGLRQTENGIIADQNPPILLDVIPAFRTGTLIAEKVVPCAATGIRLPYASERANEKLLHGVVCSGEDVEGPVF